MNKQFQITLIFLSLFLLVYNKIFSQKIENNPLLQESPLDYHAPNFNAIKTQHFKPALLEGIRLQKQAIDKIIENPAKPTFKNTILALEKSSLSLDRASNVFYALTEANTNDTLDKVQKEINPEIAKLYSKIYLDKTLFSKVKILYKRRNSLKLDQESKKLIEYYYKVFLKSGADLSDEKRKELETINVQLSKLSTDFSQKLQKASNMSAVVVTNESSLEGLSQKERDSYKEGDQWKLPLINTTQQPLLTSLANRELRKKLYDASFYRGATGKFATGIIVRSIVGLRLKKAKLLGFKNFAEWNLQNTMVKTPKIVQDFLSKLIPPALKQSKKEAQIIQDNITQSGFDFQMSPWDWNFFSEKVRQAKYELDDSLVRPYFELKTVLEKGVFYAAKLLYGITFKQREDIPTYHPDVLVYELFEESGEKLGLFYGDFFSRSSKRGGAWMSNFVDQSKLYNNKPVIYNVCNYKKPAPGDPALLSFDDVGTLFHEFGHALHGFFSNQTYPSLSGTSVARDFVEFPSQFNEYWILYPKVLDNYAIHYETKKRIPKTLVDKIKKAASFNQGYGLTELLEASCLDMSWHTLTQTDLNQDISEFETTTLNKQGFEITKIPPRYRTAYFRHIFGSGYASSYYAYQWTEMLSHDANAWFEENGGLTRENGQRFRDMILSIGNTKEYDEAYRAFRGSDPKIEAMLKARGMD